MLVMKKITSMLITASGKITCQWCKAMSKRSGEQCRRPALKSKAACNSHGGRSTGSKTAEGKARRCTALLKIGIWTPESVEYRTLDLPLIVPSISSPNEKICHTHQIPTNQTHPHPHPQIRNGSLWRGLHTSLDKQCVDFQKARKIKCQKYSVLFGDALKFFGFMFSDFMRLYFLKISDSGILPFARLLVVPIRRCIYHLPIPH